MNDAMIEFENVHKSYGGRPVIENLNLTVKRGELFVLVGASGSGKSTTLKMINALASPDGGNVYFDGRRIKDYDIRALRHRTGYVLQQIALFPTMTVEQNIALMPELLGWKKAAREERVAELLDMVGMPSETYRRRYPNELSGGEQQRIGILRAIAAKPDVLLMDEAFSALDPLSRTALQDILLNIHARSETTIVFVTHNMHEAIRLGDRIGVMQQGRLVQVDMPSEIQANPANAFVRSMFGQEVHGAGRVIAGFEQLGAAEREVVLDYFRRR